MTQERKLEVKTGTPKSINPKGAYESQFGTLYKFEVEFSDGTKGEYSSKKEFQRKFKVGESVSYEYIGGKYPKVKPIVQGSAPAYKDDSKENKSDEKASSKWIYKGKSKSEQVYIIAQNVLGRAVELCIAGVIEKRNIEACAEHYLESILKMGEKYADRVAE